MLDQDARDRATSALSAATHRLAGTLREDVELQLFGFGMRLVPPDEGLVLSWFLVPDQDDLIVTVAANDDPPGVQLTWHLDPVVPDAVNQVERLLAAGVAGHITLSLSRRRDIATAYFPDGTQSTTARTFMAWSPLAHQRSGRARASVPALPARVGPHLAS